MEIILVDGLTHIRKLSSEHHEETSIKSNRLSAMVSLLSQLSNKSTIQHIGENKDEIAKAPHKTTKKQQMTMFINKTPSSKSLSRSDGAERSGIYSYVQRSAKSRPKKTQTAAEVESAASSIVQIPRSAPRSPLPRSPGPLSVVPISSREKTNILKIIETPSPIGSAVAINKLDPFQSAAVPIDDYMGSLLKFCKLAHVK